MKHKCEWDKHSNSNRCIICGVKKENAVQNLKGTRGKDKVKEGVKV